MFTVAFQCHYLYIAPLRVDAFHEWGRGGWGEQGGFACHICIFHIAVIYSCICWPQSTHGNSSLFSQLHSVLFMRRHVLNYSYTQPTRLPSLYPSPLYVSLSLCNSCKSWIWKWHRGMSGPPSVREFHFLSLLYIHVFPLMFFYFILFSVLFI